MVGDHAGSRASFLWQEGRTRRIASRNCDGYLPDESGVLAINVRTTLVPDVWLPE
jgi:hypothetical protein